MKQYLELANTILNKGTYKEPSRPGLPGSTSYFGYQFRHNLKDGFPLLTTKKINFKNIIVELLWFLKGDTNIKWLNDNGFKLWNDDAFNYMQKKAKEKNADCGYDNTEEEKKRFSEDIKNGKVILGEKHPNLFNFIWGDCGIQYGRLWRSLPTNKSTVIGHTGQQNVFGEIVIDQLKDVLYSLKNTPEGRRHIIDSWNPDTLNDMALNACHTLIQFNCRKLKDNQRAIQYYDIIRGEVVRRSVGVYADMEDINSFILTNEEHEYLDNYDVPRYYLDCQMYQRSADTLLGVPYNIASYALLTHIFCEVLNMIPGDYIHTFGDAHIYDNHLDAIKKQLIRIPKKLPTLNINSEFWNPENVIGNNIDAFFKNLENESFLQNLIQSDIQLSNYNPDSLIKGTLSTGLIK